MLERRNWERTRLPQLSGKGIPLPSHRLSLCYRAVKDHLQSSHQRPSRAYKICVHQQNRLEAENGG